LRVIMTPRSLKGFSIEKRFQSLRIMTARKRNRERGDIKSARVGTWPEFTAAQRKGRNQLASFE
jgi:hypothetical protein